MNFQGLKTKPIRRLRGKQRSFKSTPFTKIEDELLMNLLTLCGEHFSQFVRYLPGRSKRQIARRCEELQERQSSKTRLEDLFEETEIFDEGQTLLKHMMV